MIMGLSDTLDKKDLAQMGIGGFMAYSVYATPIWDPPVMKSVPLLLLFVVGLLWLRSTKMFHTINIPGVGKEGQNAHFIAALGIAIFMSVTIGLWLGQTWDTIMSAILVAFPGTVIVDALAN